MFIEGKVVLVIVLEIARPETNIKADRGSKVIANTKFVFGSSYTTASGAFLRVSDVTRSLFSNYRSVTLASDLACWSPVPNRGFRQGQSSSSFIPVTTSSSIILCQAAIAGR